MSIYFEEILAELRCIRDQLRAIERHMAAPLLQFCERHNVTYKTPGACSVCVGTPADNTAPWIRHWGWLGYRAR